jgi:hypothetical protein
MRLLFALAIFALTIAAVPDASATYAFDASGAMSIPACQYMAELVAKESAPGWPHSDFNTISPLPHGLLVARARVDMMFTAEDAHECLILVHEEAPAVSLQVPRFVFEMACRFLKRSYGSTQYVCQP